MNIRRNGLCCVETRRQVQLLVPHDLQHVIERRKSACGDFGLPLLRNPVSDALLPSSGLCPAFLKASCVVRSRHSTNSLIQSLRAVYR